MTVAAQGCSAASCRPAQLEGAARSGPSSCCPSTSQCCRAHRPRLSVRAKLFVSGARPAKRQPPLISIVQTAPDVQRTRRRQVGCARPHLENELGRMARLRQNDDKLQNSSICPTSGMRCPVQHTRHGLRCTCRVLHLGSIRVRWQEHARRRDARVGRGRARTLRLGHADTVVAGLVRWSCRRRSCKQGALSRCLLQQHVQHPAAAVGRAVEGTGTHSHASIVVQKRAREKRGLGYGAST